MDFTVEAAQLINEGGVQCVPLVFARPLDAELPVVLADKSFLKGARVAALDPARAAQRGPGVVAFPGTRPAAMWSSMNCRPAQRRRCSR